VVDVDPDGPAGVFKPACEGMDYEFFVSAHDCGSTRSDGPLTLARSTRSGCGRL
jgi:hypothetical protein